MSAQPTLALADQETASDLALFLRRARAISDDGARLTVRARSAQGSSGTAAALDVTVPVLTRAGILDRGPEIFGVRSFPLAADPGPLDAVYEHAALLDRLQRQEGTRWPVPPAEAPKAWAGVRFPTQGWEGAGVLHASALLESDAEGSRAIAESLPASPGQAILAQARRHRWGQPETRLGNLPAGVGFAAVRLGFLTPAQAQNSDGSERGIPVHTAENWVFAQLPQGSVVIRL